MFSDTTHLKSKLLRTLEYGKDRLMTGRVRLTVHIIGCDIDVEGESSSVVPSMSSCSADSILCPVSVPSLSNDFPLSSHSYLTTEAKKMSRRKEGGNDSWLYERSFTSVFTFIHRIWFVEFQGSKRPVKESGRGIKR